MSNNIIQLNEDLIKYNLKNLVRFGISVKDPYHYAVLATQDDFDRFLW